MEFTVQRQGKLREANRKYLVWNIENFPFDI